MMLYAILCAGWAYLPVVAGDDPDAVRAFLVPQRVEDLVGLRRVERRGLIAGLSQPPASDWIESMFAHGCA